ncbi:hypothetical protein BG003_009511 [Podila horticola]|nr:hypothetical protein BG003_009511 [Podila horticola]
MDLKVTLFCICEREFSWKSFPVRIDGECFVGDLKNLIKAAKSPKFDHLSADELVLWQITHHVTSGYIMDQKLSLRDMAGARSLDYIMVDMNEYYTSK